MTIAAVAAVILLVNVPFGYWRAGLRKFSWRWFVAVHAPIPLAVALRLWAGIGYSVSSIALFASSYFAGQVIGARLGRARRGTA